MQPDAVRYRRPPLNGITSRSLPKWPERGGAVSSGRPPPRRYPDAGTILKQMGEGASNSWPVGVSVPRSVSTRRTTTLFEFWLPTIIQAPEGSKLKLRGPLPPDGWIKG